MLSEQYPDGTLAEYRDSSRFLDRIDIAGVNVFEVLRRTPLGQAADVRLGNGMKVNREFCASTGYGLCATETRSPAGAVGVW